MVISSIREHRHQSCDADGVLRPMMFATADAPKEDVGKGCKVADASETVFMTEDDARKACCACNSCTYCQGGGGEAPAAAAAATKGKAGGTRPITVFRSMDRECISPAPNTSLAVVGPLPTEEEDLRRAAPEALLARYSPGVYLSLALGGLCVAMASAMQNQLGYTMQFPNVYYLAMPVATLVPLGTAVVTNLFQVGMAVQQQSSTPKHTPTQLSQQQSQSRPQSPSKTASVRTSTMGEGQTSTWRVPLIICAIVGAVLIIGGLVALVMWLRTPPPPPFYQRPIPMAAIVCVIILVAAMFMARKKQEEPGAAPPPTHK